MKKVLVTYFSAGGVTAKVAKRLAETINADLCAIEPAQPYTRKDLNWLNPKSRSSVEMKDRNSRPALLKAVDVSGYDVVFVGFPLWWYREPSIIDTFMETADLKGKTVIPFATSGSSGMGDTRANLQALAPAADVREGCRFSARVSAEELRNRASAWL